MSRAGSHRPTKAQAIGQPVVDTGGNSGVTTQPLICADWMTAKLQTIKPRDSVARARALIEEHRINQLPVVKDGILVGIVTDRDLRDALNAVTTSANAAGTVEAAPRTPEQIPIEAVMSHTVMTLAPHSSMVAAAELMRRHRIGSVPIVDGHALVGIVTRSDILKVFVVRENSRSTSA
jgi:acetoin utilization protein AcuB